jgi:uncharacterized protein GlcG (DUF336 family)
MDHAAMTASGAGGRNQPRPLRSDNRGGFIEMQGGLRVVVDGEVIGGIGASFPTPEENEHCQSWGSPGSPAGPVG